MPRPAPAVAAFALLLGGCGAAGAGGSPCLAASCAAPSAAASAVAGTSSATAHGWTTDVITGGPRISVRVNVAGPLAVESGCVDALTAWLVSSDGTRLEASPSPGQRCQAVAIDDIASGQSKDYSADLPKPPPGRYTVHGLIRAHLPIGAGSRVSENIPVVTLVVP